MASCIRSRSKRTLILFKPIANGKEANCKRISGRISKYEREENKHLNEANKSNEDNNEKIEDELFDKFGEKSNKRNIRESLIIARKDSSFQNILITEEKLSILTKQTKIPIIQETDYTFIN